MIDCEIDDKANTYEWNGYGDSTYVIDCDIQDQLMYNDAVWIMSGNTWLNADDECDMAFYESEWTGAVVIESWAYDGDEYYYDAIAASGPEMGTSHLYIKYCGFPPTRTAYARTDCWGCFAGQNEDIVSVEFEYGKTSSFGSTTPADCVDLTNFEWEAEWAIPSYGLGDYLFVRSKATLCDSTYVMSGWSKIKVLGAGTCTEPAWWDCP